MKNLNYELRQLCLTNPQGSKSTQAGRLHILNQAANDLHDLGFKKMSKGGLKPKHVDALVEKWKANGASEGTLKNRLAHLRWWAAQVNKPGLIPKGNAALGINNRTYITNENKAQYLDGRLEAVQDSHVNMSLRLQAAFGLRREESLKFMPGYADKGDRLELKPSWTKGGRPRSIPIRTDEQRKLLEACHKLAGKGSLIPPQKSYIQQLKTYENTTAKAGFHKLHGLRHRYAQERYQQITGWKAPVDGGPKRVDLSAKDKQLDNTARQIISRELGHERVSVTAVYLGS